MISKKSYPTIPIKLFQNVPTGTRSDIKKSPIPTRKVILSKTVIQRHASQRGNSAKNCQYLSLGDPIGHFPAVMRRMPCNAGTPTLAAWVPMDSVNVGVRNAPFLSPFSSEMTAAKLTFYPIMEYFPGEFMLPVNLLIYRPKINGYQDGRRSGNFVSSSISTGFRI